MGDFVIALEVTGIGMALVFFTLVICAVVISVLNRLFRPAPEAEEEEEEMPTSVLASAAKPEAAAGNAAAAVALAIALARRAVGAVPVPVRASAEPRRAPVWARAPLFSADDEQIVGEVVTVTAIEPANPAWAKAGRMQVAR